MSRVKSDEDLQDDDISALFSERRNMSVPEALDNDISQAARNALPQPSVYGGREHRRINQQTVYPLFAVAAIVLLTVLLVPLVQQAPMQNPVSRSAASDTTMDADDVEIAEIMSLDTAAVAPSSANNSMNVATGLLNEDPETTGSLIPEASGREEISYASNPTDSMRMQRSVSPSSVSPSSDILTTTSLPEAEAEAEAEDRSSMQTSRKLAISTTSSDLNNSMQAPPELQTMSDAELEIFLKGYFGAVADDDAMLVSEEFETADAASAEKSYRSSRTRWLSELRRLIKIGDYETASAEWLLFQQAYSETTR